PTRRSSDLLKIVIASDNRLIDFGPAGYVVRLDRQHLLQRVGRAIGFQRPNFHLAETLTPELGLAAEWLLGAHAGGPGPTHLALVVDGVVQLHHIDVPNGPRPIERLSCAAVNQGHLPR